VFEPAVTSAEQAIRLIQSGIAGRKVGWERGAAARGGRGVPEGFSRAPHGGARQCMPSARRVRNQVPNDAAHPPCPRTPTRPDRDHEQERGELPLPPRVPPDRRVDRRRRRRRAEHRVAADARRPCRFRGRRDGVRRAGRAAPAEGGRDDQPEPAAPAARVPLACREGVAARGRVGAVPRLRAHRAPAGACVGRGRVKGCGQGGRLRVPLGLSAPPAGSPCLPPCCSPRPPAPTAPCSLTPTKPSHPTPNPTLLRPPGLPHRPGRPHDYDLRRAPPLPPSPPAPRTPSSARAPA
jgi:hypothetical protein